MIPHDYHMHSNFSPDCQAPMATMCRSAIAKQIPEIGFTEHFDLHADEPVRDWFKPEPWWQEIEQCRAQFGDQLTILAGIEVGEPHLFHAEMQTVLATGPFDYVLGSLHWVGRNSMFDPNYFRATPADAAYTAFFEELERMTGVGGFDILSHFDVPVRTAFSVYGGYDPRPYEEPIRAALRNCIEHGIALDLNTSALRSHVKLLTPGPDILRWYVEMGGERVTLGSDAHQPRNIGGKLEQALTIARQAGLKYVTHFRQREARLASIV
ncbi:MAG: histidinol-phosphatase HisJ family protein [Caldilineaceae bacterium]|nr:histidinol-phosphatase HisJ family protein [Caldilineaceae bacterium]